MNKKSTLALLITILGFLGIGINILLSELLYSEINEFSSTPLWYQIFMYISIIIGFIGMILSFIYKNFLTTNVLELWIELPLITIGFILMFGISLLRIEFNFKDFLVCIGGFIFFIGFGACISTMIGLFRSPKYLFK